MHLRVYILQKEYLELQKRLALHKKRKRKEMKLSKEKGERFSGRDGYPWSVYYADECHVDVSKTVSASDLHVCAAN